MQCVDILKFLFEIVENVHKFEHKSIKLNEFKKIINLIIINKLHNFAFFFHSLYLKKKIAREIWKMDLVMTN